MEPIRFGLRCLLFIKIAVSGRALMARGSMKRPPDRSSTSAPSDDPSKDSMVMMVQWFFRKRFTSHPFLERDEKNEKKIYFYFIMR